MSQYATIMKENLKTAFRRPVTELALAAGAQTEGGGLLMQAFGEACRINADRVTLAGREPDDPRGLLISLYLLHATFDDVTLEPMKAFKDLPGSMPYQGAFRANTELILVPAVQTIQRHKEEIAARWDGSNWAGGDFAFLLRPLPKIALAYIFFLADEEFPPSTTCLFSSNATSFMPLDGLADVAEYTSRGILALLGQMPLAD